MTKFIDIPLAEHVSTLKIKYDRPISADDIDVSQIEDTCYCVGGAFLQYCSRQSFLFGGIEQDGFPPYSELAEGMQLVYKALYNKSQPEDLDPDFTYTQSNPFWDWLADRIIHNNDMRNFGIAWYDIEGIFNIERMHSIVNDFTAEVNTGTSFTYTNPDYH